MNNLRRPRQIGRSIAAVVAGALTGIILSIGTDVVLHLVGFYPPLGEPASDSPLMLATVYRTAYGVLGSYVTARLAPGRPMFHALVLGGLGMLVCIAGAVTTWNKGPAFGPHWYPVALVVLAMPTAWAGAKLRLMQLGAGAKSPAEYGAQDAG